MKENWKRDSYVSLIRNPIFTATQTDWLKETEKKNIYLAIYCCKIGRFTVSCWFIVNRLKWL